MPTEVAVAAIAIAIVAAMLMMVGTTTAIIIATIVVVVVMILGARWFSGSITGVFTKSQVHNLGLDHNKSQVTDKSNGWKS